MFSMAATLAVTQARSVRGAPIDLKTKISTCHAYVCFVTSFIFTFNNDPELSKIILFRISRQMKYIGNYSEAYYALQ